MSSTLPKEIMDKIKEEAEKYLIPYNTKEYEDKYIFSPNAIRECYQAAALHYSQIIEQKDKELEKMAEEIYWWKNCEPVNINNLKSEIEQLKAENERLNRQVKNLELRISYYE